VQPPNRPYQHNPGGDYEEDGPGAGPTEQESDQTNDQNAGDGTAEAHSGGV
jgi:hypothetical protein